jgi:hypothetical protein
MRACFETKPPTCPRRWVILFWNVLFLFFMYFFLLKGNISIEGKLLNTMLHFTNFKNSKISKYQQKYANWKPMYCHIPYETFYYQELQVNKKNIVWL